ncbi:MAG TPA: 2-oxoglutarate dehydrogenase complex dihydrolipoyllysine-residue succinyltransferase [Terriglobia bacterium]|nr:2-oxoglutarate dehydrogenase complex dihydrolipoyllysine-residue succinyltransferase [Terriglobia bacterium]
MSTNIIVPELGESVLEATVGHWRKKEGDRVTPGEVVVELETDKVDLEVGAEQEGVLAKIARKEGEDVRIGDVLGVIEAAAAAKDLGRSTIDQEPSKAPQTLSSQRSEAAGSLSVSTSTSGINAGEISTPSARRLAREQGLDLARIPVSDASARLTEEDIRSLAGRASVQRVSGPLPQAPSTDATPVTPRELVGPRALSLDREERVRMSRRRMTIAQRLVEAQHTAAILTTFNEVDMGAVMDLRTRQRDVFKKRYGVGLGIVSFFLKAAIAALRDFPRLNAEVQGDDIVLKHYYDIGVAVGAAEGLVVPVLRDADRMSFAQIETGVKDFARKAREGSLTLADLRGGTFSISNGGVFGSLLSTPILNPPQVGILGLHKVEERPVALRSQIVLRPMMYVALSYDHRIVDGMEAVQFLVRVKELVEDPGTLLVES